ncbi:MAG: C4-type zinc ribbon domain-containing protein [Actinomycetota bacterium]|nr:C4-type zinc ribbon domain-containing protein [Actinomycetota bacterium]
MDVSRDTLVELLELQRIDSSIDRLTKRLRDLPEQRELDQLTERLSGLEKELAERQALLDEAAGRQRKLDNEIDSMSKKIAAEEARLYSGDVTNPRELSSLVAEVDSLKRRLAKVEDEDLEVMQEREEREGRLGDVLGEINRVNDKIAEAAAARDRAAGEVGADLERDRSTREQSAERFDRELLDFYDQLRASKGGVAAAALSGDTCLGCHMKLPAQEVARIRRSKGMVMCDECGRILVVTD